MASASVSGIHGWGNLYYLSLRGASRPAPRHGGGLGALLLCGPGMAGRAGRLTPHVCRSAVLLRPVQSHGPPTSCFLVRPPPDAHRRPHPWGGRASVSLPIFPGQAMLTSMVPRSGTVLPCAKEKR
jgi:hypothetical protein